MDRQKVNKFLKRNWFVLIVAFFIIINIGFLISRHVTLKALESSILQFQRDRSNLGLRPDIQSEFYNAPCPEISMTSIDGEKINLRDFVGDVIILKFSKFYLVDLPYLLYLEYLAKRLKEEGVFIFFINTLGKHDSQAINKFITLSSPIIEDDGLIVARFNARPNEVVIIGRDFRIKFKDYQADNLTIYNQVKKFAIGDSSLLDITGETLSSLIKKISYNDIKSNKIEIIGKIINRKKTILSLSISTCIGCPEARRLRVLKEVSQKIDLNRTQIILLFGRGNSVEIIKDYCERMTLDLSPIFAGIVEKENSLPEKDYLKIFQLDIDPRLLIFDERGELVYSERLRDKNKISADYLLMKLK